VNGNALTDSYTAARPQYNPGSWVVPADSVFVLGDNRNSSDDSRRWGYVPTSYIVGRALVVYWPFNDAKILSHPDIVKASP
jgi:signal peptidase I